MTTTDTPIDQQIAEAVDQAEQQMAAKAKEQLDAALADLAGRAAKVIADAVERPSVARARAELNDIGLRRARVDLLDSLDLIDAAQRDKRTADAALNTARSAHADAVAEAEWELAGYFEVRSNKTWLTVGDDGGALPDDEQRSMTADEKKSWIARHAAQHPGVRTAATALAAAEEDAAVARDGLALANTAMSARKHALDAAVAEAQVIAVALTAPTEETS